MLQILPQDTQRITELVFLSHPLLEDGSGGLREEKNVFLGPEITRKGVGLAAGWWVGAWLSGTHSQQQAVRVWSFFCFR